MAFSFFKFNPSQQAWKGAAVGIFLASIFLCVLSTIDLLKNNVSLGNAAIYFTLGSFLVAISGAGFVFISLLFAKIPFYCKWAIASFALAGYYFFIPFQTSAGMILLGIWTMSAFALIFGGLSSLIINRQYDRQIWPASMCILLGLAGIIFLIAWLYISKSENTPQLGIEAENSKDSVSFLNPAYPGKYFVQTLYYGSGQDLNRPEYGSEVSIVTESVNGNSFMDDWKGISGWYRKRYWGFDASKLPLNAKVWCPVGNGPFPLVLIIHGNHEMTVGSEKGYEYLSRLLATQGFIVASLDQNFLNGSWIDTEGFNEMPARAWLILEHLKLWRSWSKAEDSIFFNKIDMEKIGLIGHSRGGEAIALAAALNEFSRFPEDGNIEFDYRFNIRSLLAIAPVDGQYSFGGKKVQLDNIDYLVIQGAHDSDVRSFQGKGLYSRIDFDNDDYHFKAALYVYGVHHSVFNSLWGKHDLPLPAGLLLNRDSFLKEEEQRQIVKVYASAFLKASLFGEKRYLSLLQSWKMGKDWLPKSRYFNQFSDSLEISIIKNGSHPDLEKTALKGVRAQGNGLLIWKQEPLSLREGKVVDTGVLLGWNKNALNNPLPMYTLTFPKDELSLTSSSFLVLNLAEGWGENEKDGYISFIDFTVEFEDHNGQIASLPLSRLGYVEEGMQVDVMKHPFLDPLKESEIVFQTFELPIVDFILENPVFDPASIKSLKLKFDRTSSGFLMIGSIGYRL